MSRKFIVAVLATMSIMMWAYAQAADGKVIDASTHRSASIREAGLAAINSSDPDCDSPLAIDSASPGDAAKAMDICKMADGPGDWGLISASWVVADVSPVPSTYSEFHWGHGIFTDFGSVVHPQHGAQMLALSTGRARRPTDPGYVPPNGGTAKGYNGNPLSWLPFLVPTCAGACTMSNTPLDDAGLAVTLRVPWFANGFSFDFKFYTAEFPEYICGASITDYVDVFIAILSPFPQGSTDGNIAFDPSGNLVRQGESLLQVCTPDGDIECFTCPSGAAELQGTGYENDAGSPWLTATAAAEPGAVITLRFAIFDTEDWSWDSIVLIDDFEWIEAPYFLWFPLITQ